MKVKEKILSFQRDNGVAGTAVRLEVEGLKFRTTRLHALPASVKWGDKQEVIFITQIERLK